MTQAIWTATYDINSLVLNPQKRLGLYGLLNILQDAAWLHADHLGCGYAAMRERGTIWVLTRQKLAMEDWPRWGETLSVRTWARPFVGPIAPRDFEMRIGERLVGLCTTTWLTLDGRTHRPLRHSALDIVCRTDGALSLEPEKIPSVDGAAAAARFHVRNSDLDLNGHVNNTRYAQWILDTEPLDVLARHRVSGYEINFLAETKVGDEVTIEKLPLSAAADGESLVHYQGRTADGKAAFSARLGLVPA